MDAATRILIADDNSQIRRVIRQIVEQDSHWKICGEAVNGGDAVQRVAETKPDLIVLDFSMPGMNGLEAAREIAKVAPETPVLLCTAHLSKQLIEEARRAGIYGAVSKSRPDDLVNGIKALLRREMFFCQPN